MDDYLEEELKIMKEQDQKDTAISSEVFRRPIKDMKLKPAICMEANATIGSAIKKMRENNFGSILISQNNKLIGIFTERDVLRRVIGIIPDFETKPLSQVMTKDPICLREDDMICYVLNNMHIGGYRHVPIVDEGQKPISIISIKDVVGYILDQFPTEITNILDRPYRGKHTREGA